MSTTLSACNVQLMNKQNTPPMLGDLPVPTTSMLLSYDEVSSSHNSCPCNQLAATLNYGIVCTTGSAIVRRASKCSSKQPAALVSPSQQQLARLQGYNASVPDWCMQSMKAEGGSADVLLNHRELLQQ
jgi:hypothetical protein